MNGVGELHSTTLEVTMDSFFSGVQLHFTIDLANSVSVETDFIYGKQRSIFQMSSQNKVLILGIGDFAPTSKLRPGST